jgi:hypothetical protein
MMNVSILRFLTRGSLRLVALLVLLVSVGQPARKKG